VKSAGLCGRIAGELGSVCYLGGFVQSTSSLPARRRRSQLDDSLILALAKTAPLETRSISLRCFSPLTADWKETNMQIETTRRPTIVPIVFLMNPLTLQSAPGIGRCGEEEPIGP